MSFGFLFGDCGTASATTLSSWLGGLTATTTATAGFLPVTTVTTSATTQIIIGRSSITGISNMYYESAWQEWVDNTSMTVPASMYVRQSTAVAASAWQFWVHKHSETIEQRRLREEQDQRYREEQARQQQERTDAEQRAHQLLLDVLTPQQRELYDRTKLIVVKGGKSGKEYQIDTRHSTHNVTCEGRRYCAHTPGYPIGDIIVAQKLAIEQNEEHFLERANVS
jgi:hypothetical protein